MIIRVSPVALLAAALALSGCVETDLRTSSWQGAGTVLGAAAGAAAGSEFGAGTGNLAATGAGVLIGALAGNEIGKSLGTADRTALTTPTDQRLAALPSNRPSPWRDPDASPVASAGPLGTVSPIRGRSGTCREYQQTITVNGQKQPGYGTACLQPDGSWKIVR